MYFMKFHIFPIGSGMGMIWDSPIPILDVDSLITWGLLCINPLKFHIFLIAYIWGMVWDCHILYQSQMVVGSSLWDCCGYF